VKDCATCKHRVELNPKYAKKKWEDTPCSRCSMVEPFGGNKRFDDAILYELIDARSKRQKDTVLTMLAHVFKCWIQLEHVEQQILSERIIRPFLSVSQVAKMYSMSRVTLYKIYQKIAIKFPALKTLTPYSHGDI